MSFNLSRFAIVYLWMDKSIFTIGNNVAELRDALGLSQKDFALLANISRTTLVNIESGKNNFKIGSLDGILNFVSMNLEELSVSTFHPPGELRETLTAKYKGNTEISVILAKEPSIPYCIKYKLLTTDFLDTPRETQQISKFINNKFGWVIKGNSLHSALKRIPELVQVLPHPTKKATNIYVRK